MLVHRGTDMLNGLGFGAFDDSAHDGKACYDWHSLTYMNNVYMVSAKRNQSKELS